MEKLHVYLYIAIIRTVVGISNPDPVIVRLNQDAYLQCRLLMQNYSGVEVRWFNGKDGLLTSGTTVSNHHGQLDVDQPAPNEWNLRIRRVKLSFEDNYMCKTGEGKLIAFVKLLIGRSPKIDKHQSSPEHETFSEGSTARLKCVVTGTPEPEIKWYREETEIGITGPVLKIPNITRYAADEYVCRASNEYDQAEKRIRITVNFAPEVTVMEPEVYASGKEVAVMSCVVQASPLNDAYWTFGTNVYGDKISTNWKYIVQVAEGGKGMPVRFLTLIKRKVFIEDKDYGNYTCIAKGEGTVVKGTVTLQETKAVATEEGENVIKYN